MKLNKIKAYLGFAKKMGRLSYGQTVLKDLNSKHSRLVLIDNGAAENTKDKYSCASASVGVKWLLMPPGEIADAIGKPNVRVVCVKDDKLISAILENLD